MLPRKTNSVDSEQGASAEVSVEPWPAGTADAYVCRFRREGDDSGKTHSRMLGYSLSLP